jgi:hypothetical protein
MQVVPGDGNNRCVPGQEEPGESGEIFVAGRKTDGHTGVEYEVLSRLSIQPRGERLTVALARLREADWWQHYVLHSQPPPTEVRGLSWLRWGSAMAVAG